MFIIKEEIKESIRKLRRAWSCCWLINPLVYGNISRAGGQLEEERIKIFLESGDLLLQFNVDTCPNQHLFGSGQALATLMSGASARPVLKPIWTQVLKQVLIVFGNTYGCMGVLVYRCMGE